MACAGKELQWAIIGSSKPQLFSQLCSVVSVNDSQVTRQEQKTSKKEKIPSVLLEQERGETTPAFNGSFVLKQNVENCLQEAAQ